jgi:hypothetical protein
LLGLTGTPQFAALATHAFFTLQQFFCEAIPKLETPAEPLMRAVRALVEKAGNDLASNLPNVEFRKWCGADLARARETRRGRAGRRSMHIVSDRCARCPGRCQFDLVAKYVDERRLSGLFALGHIKFADGIAAEDAIALLLPFVDAGQDDVVRAMP